MSDTIYQVKIILKGSKPEIWRRILVPANVRLADLHKIIQIAFGWEDAHLHQFIKNNRFYAVHYPNDPTWYEMDNIDYIREKMLLSDLLGSVKEVLEYEYDFGDGWMHVILLEKKLPVDPDVKYPLCLDGKRSGPPEDCGGIWGYADLLEILKNPKHEEYESYKEWVGKRFDPESFNLDKVNRMFQKLKLH